VEPKICWPLQGNFPITFRFGEDPKWYRAIFGYPHNGLDLACPVGTPVFACDQGKVIFSDDIPDGNGEGLILEHLWGQSLYWHTSRNNARFGEIIPKLTVIAYSGNTGYTTGPHLHFGIKVRGVEIPGMRGWADPSKYLTGESLPPSVPLPVTKTHLVLPGDTLWGLASKYYKNGTEWPRIYEANKEKISNPNLIRPFQRLLIP
jgi:murein DD-endopeptidase MepM/ murein hydrolase activator NlpD